MHLCSQDIVVAAGTALPGKVNMYNALVQLRSLDYSPLATAFFARCIGVNVTKLDSSLVAVARQYQAFAR